MSARKATGRALLAVTALAAGPALAVDLSGAVGTGGSRSDSFSPGAHSDALTWDWEASAAAAGTPLRPGLLQWLAGVEYRSLRTYYFDSRNRADGLTYHGQLSLFSDSMVPLTVSASRSRSDFSNDKQGPLGSSVITTEAGTALLRAERYPTLRLALTRTDVDTHALGAPEALSDSTALSVSAGQSLPTEQYQLGFDTSWNHGTFAETNYHSYALNLQASAAVADDVMFRFFDRYYRRDPTVNATTNPRYDDNAIGTGVQWRPGTKTTASFDYAYRHLLVDVKDAPKSEQAAHALTQSTWYRWTPNLSVFGTGGLSYALERLGVKEEQSATESLGGGATWSKDLAPRAALRLGGGGSIGVAEPWGQAVRVVGGVNGSGGISASLDRIRASLTYSGNFQQGALRGSSTLDQRLLLQGDALADMVFLTGQAVISGARRDDPLLGAFVSRSTSISLGGFYKKYNAQLSAGMSDGLSTALDGGLPAEGFILPVEFNTHTRFVTLSSSYVLDAGRWTLSGLARSMELTAPGRPLQYEHGVSFTTGYAIGAFTLSLEERFSAGGAGSSWQRGNLVMARIVRTFGASF